MAITFLSAAAVINFAGAWKPAIISAVISGVLSGLIELKDGLNRAGPPQGRVSRLVKDKKAESLFRFGYV